MILQIWLKFVFYKRIVFKTYQKNIKKGITLNLPALIMHSSQTINENYWSEKFKEGDAIYIKGHEAHASLIQQEARGESVAVNMLLMHAEDQLMAAENFKAFAQQQIVIFKKFQDIENR